MTTSTSPEAYADAYEYLDQALTSDYGIRIRLTDQGKCRHLRTRLHYARQLDRNLSKQAYERDNPLWGKSAYDKLVVRLSNDEQGWYLQIEPIVAAEAVEVLGPGAA